MAIKKTTLNKKKKKILILSMTGGFGHIRAGEALLDYAKAHLPGIEAKHVDAATISPSLKKYGGKLYDAASKKFPWVWKMFYEYFPVSLAKKIVETRSLFDPKIKEYIAKEKPDGIIFTNVVILPMFLSIVRSMFEGVKMGVVVTDYHGHAYYNFPDLDFYFVAHEQVGQDLESLGVDKHKIAITGIPVNPKFYIKHSVKELKVKHGIKNNLPVVVLITSFGISQKELLKVVGDLLEVSVHINLICLSNGNKDFFNILKKSFGTHQRFFIIPWTDSIEEYIAMSDVVISKAGGLTVSECLTLQKPMIIVKPIPGQEEHNARFLEKNNFGTRVDNVYKIKAALLEVLSKQKVYKKPAKSKINPYKSIFKYFV